MLSVSNLSRATRRIREHMAKMVPAIMQSKPHPKPTTVLTTLGRKQTFSPVESLEPEI